MNNNYYSFATQAVNAEKAENYSQAGMYWGKAAEHAKKAVNQIYCEQRVELNKLRHTVLERYEAYRKEKAKQREEKRIKKELSEALKNINVQDDYTTSQPTPQKLGGK